MLRFGKNARRKSGEEEQQEERTIEGGAAQGWEDATIDVEWRYEEEVEDRSPPVLPPALCPPVIPPKVACCQGVNLWGMAWIVEKLISKNAAINFCYPTIYMGRASNPVHGAVTEQR